MKGSKKLYLLVVVMSVFIIGVGWYGTHELKTINQHTQKLYLDRVIPLQQLTTIRFSYIQGIFAVEQQLQNHAISIQEAEHQIEQTRDKIASNWSLYKLTYLTDEEKVEMLQTEKLMQESDQLIENFQVAIMKSEGNTTDILVDKKLYNSIQAIVQKLSKLIELQVKVGDEIRKDSVDQYNITSTRFYMLIAFSLICAIALSLYIITSIQKLIKNLKTSKDKITEIGERYRSLLEHAGDPIFVLNEDTTFNEVNMSTCNLLGYSEEKFKLMKLANIFAPGEIDRLPVQLHTLLTNKTLLTERKWRKRDGTEIDIEVNVRLLADENKYLCIARDITERKKIEEKIKESEKKYRNIFENAQDVFYQATIDGIILDVSPSLKNHLGYEREELIGQSVSMIYADVSKREKLVQTLKQKGEFKEYEMTFKSNLGKDVFISLDARLIYDNNGKPSHIDGMFRNITERKLMLAQLVENQEQLTLTLQQLENRVQERTKELFDKNISILDSIKYAKRIQIGLLTPPSKLKEIFPKSFMISVPRDIVSGDFFWCHEREQKKFIIVADCTGHGVPGALMSVICNSLMEQIIVNEGIEEPSRIMEELDKRLKQAVKGDEEEVKDGMDLILCIVDKQSKQISFAGANNSLYLTSEKHVVQEIHTSRVAIGGTFLELKKQFETKTLNYFPGQRIYLTSDGFYAQFGGIKGKKFMKSHFTDTLTDLQSNFIEKQKQLLMNVFLEWKGNNQQVDDVLVVGIEL